VAARLAASDAAEPVIVSLGGDGTHNHVLQASLDCGGRGLFLRLPLGSGNDAAGTESLEQSLVDLEGVMAPRWIPAVRIRTPQWERYAFNIASVGLDAYVTILHEKWRRILPGNTYRLLVDLAVLRYDQALEVGPIALRGTAFDGSTVDLGTTPRSLVVMGASGNRTYGDHMRVLPGEENVCVIERAGLLEKLRMKQLFYEGRHVDEPITAMYRLQRLAAEYSGTLPLQYDGEARYLNADDFPLTMEAVRSAVRVLTSDRLSSTGAVQNW
jgi:diacylglycerol kinase family enzyme